jgi:hypothetical protein
MCFVFRWFGDFGQGDLRISVRSSSVIASSVSTGPLASGGLEGGSSVFASIE